MAAEMQIRNSVGEITRMASAASRCSEKLLMASAPKKSSSVQNRPIRPNIATLRR